MRQVFIQERKALSPERKMEATKQIFEKLKDLPDKTILSFSSFHGEIDLWKLNELFAKKEKLVLPRVSGNKLQLFRVLELHELIKSKWGILEPNPATCKQLGPSEISCALIPGLAFDSNANRIGYGKGYYDRLILELIHAKTIGVGYLEQLSDDPLPIEPHDQALDELILV